MEVYSTVRARPSAKELRPRLPANGEKAGLSDTSGEVTRRQNNLTGYLDSGTLEHDSRLQKLGCYATIIIHRFAMTFAISA